MNYKNKVRIPCETGVVEIGTCFVPFKEKNHIYYYRCVIDGVGEVRISRDCVEAQADLFEPIEEPKWTDSDMINFLIFSLKLPMVAINILTVFQDYKKECGK